MDKVTEFIPAAQIADRVKELGEEITRDYAGKSIFVIGVLKGSFMFLADLVRHIDLEVEISFISVSSYQNASQSSGEVRLLFDLDKPLEGKHVVLVEDIIDSGHTISFLKNTFAARKAASLKVCTLLSKPSRRQVELEADYTGFEIEDKFAVGYGLDYAGKYRNLPGVFVVEL